MYSINSLARIHIGRQGETGLRKVVIDCTAWTEAYSGITIILLAIRPGDDEIYMPAGVTVVDGILTWVPDASDTQTPGFGRCALQGIDAGGNIIKSVTAATEVETAIGIEVSAATEGPAAVVSVSDALAMPLIGLTVRIAKQDGSGDPGPENVRQITGVTGAKVFVAPEVGEADPAVELDWTAEPGAVYGGVLDVLAGKLTVTHQEITITSDTVNPSGYSPGTNGNRVGFDLTAKSGVYLSGNSIDMLCSVGTPASLVNENASARWAVGMCALYKGTPQSYFRYIVPTTYTSAADALTYLQNLGCEITVPLAAPVTYQLTSRQVHALLGAMSVWSDGGDVTVSYIRQGGDEA